MEMTAKRLPVQTPTDALAATGRRAALDAQAMNPASDQGAQRRLAEPYGQPLVPQAAGTQPSGAVGILSARPAGMPAQPAPQQFAAPASNRMDPWTARNEMRNAETQASSIDRRTSDLGKARMAELKENQLAAMREDGAGQRAAMDQNGGLARESLQQGGASARAVLEGGLKQQALDAEGVRNGFANRAASRLEQAQINYLNQTDPTKRASAAQTLAVLSGKADTPTPPSGYRWAPGGDLQAIPGGPGDKAQQGKPMPTAAAAGLLGNRENLRRAESALALLNGETLPSGAVGDPEATGLKGYLPNQVLNRLDPKGVDTRAAIADLGSLVIHDRSGAAVTAAEFPRLAPFIPTEKDDPATARKKLDQFAKNYQATIDDSTEFYRQMGYTVPEDRASTQRSPTAAQGAQPSQGAQGGAAQQPVSPAQPPQMPQAGEVRRGYRFKGGDPADRNNWEASQ